MSSDKKSAELNPRTTEYEFLGPVGAFFITLAVPITTYALYFGCSEQSGGCPPQLSTIPDQITLALSSPAWWRSLWDTEATVIYFGWYAFCVVAWAVLPGDRIEGVTLRTGGKKTYKINAFSTYLLALGITTGIIYNYGPQAFTFFYEKWVGFAIACYIASFGEGKILALGGNSGNFIYDVPKSFHWMFDVKSFNELRPGLILWTLINISMACEQATRRGGLTNITDSMWLIQAFQAWYVIDGLYNEPAIFTTMDITTDGFGFMLSVGDLTWVPFFYSLQARYLAYNHVELGQVWTAGIFLLNITGYYIFRDANGEKNDFRNGKNPKNLTYFTTSRGSKLLTSGWWGRSRHPNYLGDLVMSVAWCLPTGFESPIPYFYIIYFAILLIHRQRRDDENCQKKYGADWEKYKKMVPARIVPYIY
ncbi:ERG4/ERG24 ergosterol biosynthesis protein [Infundibulicybe gibba]|nr:ERG4/ERG24 ergosterol biosynthesis protein [Infundibulicybe gibba]